MEWRIGICGTPSKNFSKKFEKPLDKHHRMWYNEYSQEGKEPNLVEITQQIEAI